MKDFYTLFFYQLDTIEKITLLTLTVASFLVFSSTIKSNINKKRKKRILKQYLYVKNNKWQDVIYLLTTPSPIAVSDIKHRLQVDLSKFDLKYKDILYYELRKIRQTNDINPANWRLFMKTLHPERRSYTKKKSSFKI